MSSSVQFFRISVCPRGSIQFPTQLSPSGSVRFPPQPPPVCCRHQFVQCVWHNVSAVILRSLFTICRVPGDLYSWRGECLRYCGRGGGRRTQGMKLDITSHWCHLSGTLSCISNRPEFMQRDVQPWVELQRTWFWTLLDDLSNVTNTFKST